MPGLTSLLIQHLYDRRAAEENVRRYHEAERDRTEVREHRALLKAQGKEEEPMTPEQFRSMVDPERYRRKFKTSLTEPKK